VNNQQARIYAYLDEAIEQFEEDGVVDTFLQSQLVEEGYPICQLDRDLTHIISKRNTDAAQA
jgi:hypothetical protein